LRTNLKYMETDLKTTSINKNINNYRRIQSNIA